MECVNIEEGQILLVDLIDRITQKSVGTQVKVKVMQVQRDYHKTKVTNVKVKALEDVDGVQGRTTWVRPKFLHALETYEATS